MLFPLSKSYINSMESKDQSPYTLCETPDYFYLRCLTTGPLFSPILGTASKTLINSSSNHHLSISRKTNKMAEISPEEYKKHLQQVSISHVIKFDLLFGMIIVNQEPYLILVVSSEQVAKYIEYPIFNVIDVKFLPYRSKKYQKDEQTKEEEKVIEMLQKSYISQNYYFSYKEIITSSLSSRKDKEGFQFNQFAWNQELLFPFLDNKVHRCWTIPVIQGFVGEITKSSIYFSWGYLNISRRSIHMSGTRFNSRGLDEEAHASNFVETEEIIKCHNQLYVHVSIRGSVPLFWKQLKVRGAINFIKQSANEEQVVMRKHYQQLQTAYNGTITTINLLSKQKSPEKQLKNRFQAMLARNIERPYLCFDLNSIMEVKSDGQMQINKFIAKNWENIFGKHPFSVYQNLTLEIKQTQSIIPRINCLDCLDRTNVMMARISEAFIYSVADKVNKEVEIQEKQLIINQPFIEKLIKLWAALGDRISKIYCGTGSVAAHMTLKQNNSIFSTLGGALTSFNRYINAAHSDVFKQKCIDSLLGLRGELSKTSYFYHNSVNEIKEGDYCSFKEIGITVITFNTGGTSQSQNGGAAGIQSFLIGSITNKDSQIVVFALQEVDNQKRWTDSLQEAMSQFEYTLLIQVQTQKASLLSLIFIKKGSNNNYKYLQMIETPLRSNAGLTVFVSANDSLLCFVNLRLQGGYLNRYLRLDDFNELHSHLLRQTYSSQMLTQAQAVFLAGDFNMRLSNNIEKEFKFKNSMEYLCAAEAGNREDPQLIKDALIYDELEVLKKSHFFEYFEQDINFFPTYCFKKGGYDKSRPPAWCDRILFAEPDYIHRRGGCCVPIVCKKYARIQERLGSTHKGVVGCFQMSIRSEDEKKKRELVDRYFHTIQKKEEQNDT